MSQGEGNQTPSTNLVDPPVKDWILVASHQRSGTHFLIDSLRLNLKGAAFPLMHPSYPSLENLLLPHGEDVFEGFLNHAAGANGAIPIFKTHLLPSEIEAACTSPGPLAPEERTFLEDLYRKACKVYIRRDGRDVLVSLYHLMREGVGLHSGLKTRLAMTTFSDFIRMPNNHIHTVRSFQPFDANRVTYWLHHVEEWMSVSESLTVNYEDLHGEFEQSVIQLANDLSLGGSLVEPIRRMAIGPVRKRPLPMRLAKKLINPGGITSTAVLPRKGIVGDWKNHFDEDDLRFYLDNVGDRTGDIAGYQDRVMADDSSREG